MADTASNASQFPSRPETRHGFRVAIICALSIEAEMVERVLDRDWTVDSNRRTYGKAPGDRNTYKTGAIGRHNVVIAYMPEMGGYNAAAVTAGLNSSFTRIEIAFVVGICGVSPIHPETAEEIVLGDCIISTSIIQYDLGRQYPGGFKRRYDLDGTNKPTSSVKSMIAMLKTRLNREWLQQKLVGHLEQLQESNPIYYPGSEKDWLFSSSYLHTHRPAVSACDKCIQGLQICTLKCESIGCEKSNLIPRDRLKKPSVRPRIHFGLMGSANTVMRSGAGRDALVTSDKLLAFEMEGSGVFHTFPTVIIKSACDYADSHKNKDWQSYAAATAAAGLKAVLEKLDLPDHEELSKGLELVTLASGTAHNTVMHQRPVAKPVRTLPFARDRDFIGREDVLGGLLQDYTNRKPGYHLRLGLLGMGGVGKSQIAIEFGYRLMKRRPTVSILWIHAGSRSRFEQGYRDIASAANIPIPEESQILDTVQRWLSDSNNGEWLMILDNVDDDQTFTSRVNDVKSLRDFLPVCGHGSILITSRNQIALNNVVGNETVLNVEPFGLDDSLDLLATRMNIDPTEEYKAQELVQSLEYLPLAISHAGAYIKSRRPTMSIARYLTLFRDKRMSARLLSDNNIADTRRDTLSARTVISTWQISFEAINDKNKRAADLLALICMFDNQGIPEYLLKRGPIDNVWNKEPVGELTDNESASNDEDFLDFVLDEDLSLLSGYSLLIREADNSSVRVHRLVQLSMTQWLQQTQKLEGWQWTSVLTVARHFICNSAEQHFSRQLLPHVKKVLEYPIDKNNVLAKVGLMEAYQIYMLNAGHDYEANQMIQKALPMCEQYLGSYHPVTLRSRAYAGKCANAMGQFAHAEGIFRSVVKSYSDSEVDNLDSVVAKCSLGQSLWLQGKDADAEDVLRPCLVRSIELFGYSHRVTGITMLALAKVLGARNKHSEAHGLLQRYSASKAGNMISLGDVLHLDALGTILSQQGQFQEAEIMFRKALIAVENSTDAGPTYVLGMMHGLARSLQHQAKYLEAEQLYFRMLGIILATTLNEQDLRVLQAVAELCQIRLHLGRYAEVEIMAREWLDKENIPFRETLFLKNNLEWSLIYQGKLVAAEGLARTLVEEIRSRPDIDAVITASAINALCTALEEQGKLAEAEIIRRDSLQTAEKDHGVDSPETRRNLRWLALNICWQRRYEEAETLFQRLCNKEQQIQDNPADEVNALAGLCFTIEQQNRWNEAQNLRRKLLETIESSPGQDPEGLHLAREELAVCMFAQQKITEAESIWREMLATPSGQMNSTPNLTSIPALRMYEMLMERGVEMELDFLTRYIAEEAGKATGLELSATMESLQRMGISLLNREKPKDAVILLQKVVDINVFSDTFELEDTVWYLSEALDLLGKADEAASLREQYGISSWNEDDSSEEEQAMEDSDSDAEALSKDSAFSEWSKEQDLSGEDLETDTASDTSDEGVPL